MINKLKEIKELRKTRKLVAEEELRRLEKDYKLLISLAKVRPVGHIFSIDQKGLSDDEFENRREKIAQRIENVKIKINQLEKDLENLTNLENKFKQESQATA